MAKKKTTKKKSSNMDKKIENKIRSCCKGMDSSCKGGCTYFLAFLGAAIYYISTATGFWVGVWGVIKALVWPAFLVYRVFQFLGM